MLAVLAAGALGGWLAASGRLPLLTRSDAAPPDQTITAPAAAACCDGAERGVLLAQANPPTAGLPFIAAQPAGSGKKPNILFIMGDDIGWMQPACYHRGLMVGETPNIDRIANEGAIFMDYVAMQSCTSGRNAFITGMYPLRTGMIPPQLPGSPS